MTNGQRDDIFNFDASKSNPIYSNSNTVQPPGIGVIWCIQYASVFDDDLNIPIMSISVNEKPIAPDENRNVNIDILDYSPDYNNLQLIADDFWYNGEDGVYNSSTAYKINVPGYLYFDHMSNSNYKYTVDSMIYVAKNPNYFNGYYYRNRARTAVFYKDIDGNYSNNARIFIMPGKDTWINVGVASCDPVALMFVPCKFVKSEYSNISPDDYIMPTSFVPPSDDASYTAFKSISRTYNSVGEDQDKVNNFWNKIASGSIYIDNNGNQSTTININTTQPAVTYTQTWNYQQSKSLIVGTTVPLYNLVKMDKFNPFAGDWKDNFDKDNLYEFIGNIPEIVNQKYLD